MVISLAVDPTDDGVVYAGTEYSGVFKTLDGGTLWLKASAGMPANSYVTALTVDPLNSQLVYAGVSSTLYKSTNGGGTWSPSGNLPGAIRGIVVDPSNSNRVYALTSSGVSRSTNAGGIWTSQSSPASFFGWGLAIDPNTPTTLYAATIFGPGVLKSTDGGVTWTGANSGLSSADIRSVAVDPGNSLIVYAATSAGTYRSTNAGSTWTFAATGSSTVAVGPVSSSSVYTGSYVGGLVYGSVDSGSTWILKNAGINGTRIESLAVGRAAGTVYAGLRDTGVYKSTDRGSTWTHIVTGLVGMSVTSLAFTDTTATGLLAGTSGGGVFRRAIPGALAGGWSASNSGLQSRDTRALVVDPTNPSIVYNIGGSALCTCGVFKSIDAGATWTYSSTGLTDTANDWAIAVDPLSPSTVYVATSAGVFKSINGAATWSASNAGITALDIRAIAVDPVNSTNLYAVGNGGVFKSTNHGVSWTLVKASLGGFQFAIAIDPVTPSTAYVVTTSAVYKTTDGGATWTQASFIFSSNPNVAMDPRDPAKLYVGSSNGSVYRTIDAGATWASSGTGLSGNYVLSTAVDPVNSATVYAGTTAGVYRSDDSGVIWKPDRVVPTLSWPPPAPISYGTALSTVQLRATANVPGTFSYLPPIGAVLNGGTQLLSVTFVPNDTVTYAGAATTTWLTVNKATPVISWTTPAPITDGTALSAAQLNATANTPGTFAYTPTLGTVLAAGSQTLTVTFTPADVVNYTTATADVVLTVKQVQPSGTTLVSSQNPSDGGQPVMFTATVSAATGTPTGTVLFSDGGTPLGTATIDPTGVATLSTDVFTLFVGPHAISASYGGDGRYAGSLSNIVTQIVNGSASTTVVTSSKNPSSTGEPVTFTAKVNVSGTGTPAGIVRFLDNGSLIGTNSLDAVSRTAKLTVQSFAVGTHTITARYIGGAYVGSSDSNPILQTVNGVQSGPTGGNIRDVRVDPSNHSIVYAADVTRGFFKSTNGGANWVPINVGVSSLGASALAIDPVVPTTIYGGSGVLYKSTNGGATWTSLVTPTIYPVFEVAIDPLNSSTLYAAVSSDGVIKSTDGGMTWAKINTGLSLVTFNDYAVSIAIDPVNTANLYVAMANDKGVFKSTDAGATWTAMNSGLTLAGITGVAVDPFRPATVYVLEFNNPVFKSTNGGASWTAISNPNLTNSDTIAFDPSVPTTVYTAGNGLGVFRSTDGGVTFVNRSSGLPQITKLAIAKSLPSTIYAGTIAGVFKSVDGAATWQPTGQVSLAAPTITWPAPAAISYGTVLGASQLNATANVPGTFTYTPAAGVVLTAGSQTLLAIFTPVDTNTYSNATASAILTVNKTTPTLAWNTPAPISYGTALSPSQLNASADTPGTLAYSPPPGSLLATGTQSLSVTFTPTDSINFVPVTKAVNLTVNPATPTIVVNGTFTYDGRTHGAAVSARGVGGASISGSFSVSYTPDGSSAPLNAGTYSVTATFTSADPNYTSATGTGLVTINPATPTVTTTGGTFTYNAVSHGASATATGIGGATVPGTFWFSYSGSPTPPINAGAYDITTTFTSSDPNYASTTQVGLLCVTAPAGLVSWWRGEKDAADFVGRNDGLLQGGIMFAPGKVGLALSLDGVDDFVDVANSSSLDAITSAITVDAWINPLPPVPPLTEEWFFVRTNPLVRDAFSLSVTTDGRLRVIVGLLPSGTSHFESAPGVIVFGQFQHVAGSANTATGAVKAYVNGQPVGLTRIFGAPLNGEFSPSDHLFIGRRQSSAIGNTPGTPGPAYYRGVIDEITLYGTELTEGQIARIHAAGAAGKCGPAALTILPAAPTVTATGGTFTYDAQPHSVTGLATGVGAAPVQGTFAFTYTPAGIAAPVNVGSYTATGTFTSSDPNYSSVGEVAATVTIVLATPVVSISGTFTYDGQPHAPAVMASAGGASAAGSFAITYTPGGSSVPVNASTYAVTVAFTSSDPNFTNASGTGSFVIAKASPTLAVTGGTFAYDGLSHSAGATAKGLGGVTLPGTLTFTYAPGGAALPVNPAVYQATAAFTSGDPNYADASGSASITIKGEPTVIVGGGPFSYNGAAHPALAIALGLTGNTVAGVVTFAYTPGGASPPVNAGTYAVSANFVSADPAYHDVSGVIGTLTIDPAAPATAISAGPFTYDGATHPAVVVVSGVAGVSVAGSLEVSYLPGGVSAPVDAGNYSVTAKFTSVDPNYASTTKTVTLAINKAAPAIAVSGATLGYNGLPRAATATATGITGTTIAGTFAFTYTPGGSSAPIVIGTYGVTASFTSGDPNYANTSGTGSIVIVPLSPLAAITLSTNQAVYRRGQPVVITGRATSSDGSGIANIPVHVQCSLNGSLRTFNPYTDAQGMYHLTFQPAAADGGALAITAMTSAAGVTRTSASTVRIVGLFVTPGMVNIDQAMGTERSIAFDLQNVGDAPLGNMSYSLKVTPPDNVTARVSQPTTALGAGASSTISVIVTSAAGEPPGAPVSVQLRISATDDVSGSSSEESPVMVVALKAAVSTPIVTPASASIGVNPGKSHARQFQVTNTGYVPMVDGAVVLSSSVTPSWVSLSNGALGNVAPGEVREFQLRISPPSDVPFGDYTVPFTITGATSPAEGIVHISVTPSTLGEARFVVNDDIGAKVHEATVTLQETTNGKVFQGITDADGHLTISGVDVGTYSYVASAAKHDDTLGTLTVTADATTETPVLLSYAVVTVSFTVTPTTIVDEYSVTLNVTYSTTLPKPALQVVPYSLDFSFFPEDVIGGQYACSLEITNTHPTAHVRNLIVDASQVDLGQPEGQRLHVTFADGSSVYRVGVMPGKGRTTVGCFATLDNGSIPSHQAGQVLVQANYDYSLDGRVFEGTTVTKVPVAYIRPSDLSIRPVPFTYDKRTDPEHPLLKYEGEGFVYPVKNNRTLSLNLFRPSQTFDGRNIVAFSATQGGANPIEVINANASNVFWRTNFNSGKETLQGQGDATAFDISTLDPPGETGSTLEQALNAQIAMNAERVLSLPSFLGFEGQWSDGTPPQGFLVPLLITTIGPDSIKVQGGMSRGDGGGDEPCVDFIVPGCFDTPQPRYVKDGTILLAIDQKVRLERQAFNATLGLNASATLTNVIASIQISDIDGHDASGRFFVLVTSDPRGATHGGTVSGQANVSWQLIPSAEAGGSAPEGLKYVVRGNLTYLVNGVSQSVSTKTVTITVLPSPKLQVAYTMPFVVMPGKDALIRITVTNVGHGTAKNLSIETAQPRIVATIPDLPLEELLMLEVLGIPVFGPQVDFNITGSSNTADSSGYLPNALTVQFGDVPAGATVSGYWTLRASRKGFFIDLTSTFKHEDYRGIQLDPLVLPPTTELIPAIGGNVTSGGSGVPNMRVMLKQAGVEIDSDYTDDAGTYYIRDLAAGTYLEEVRDGIGDLVASKNITVLGDQGTNFIDFTISGFHAGKRPATVTFDPASLTQVYDGTLKQVRVVTTPPGLTVSVSYDGSFVPPIASGAHPVVATIVDPSYAGTAAGVLTIGKASPVIIWAPPAPIQQGTPLSGIQLNATVKPQ